MRAGSLAKRLLIRLQEHPTLIINTIGAGSLLLLLLDYLRPTLLTMPTIPAGGDTPCHFPTAVDLRERLLPHLRIHGWYPGAYLGHPQLLYYFPLPFLLMAAISVISPMSVAFKLAAALGVFLLPLFTFFALRKMGLEFPTPLFGAAAATVFLFVEENPIWGGTIASMLTGELAYSMGMACAVLFLGVVYEYRQRGGRPWCSAVVLALTALAHGYAVLWAGLSATYLLWTRRKRLDALRRLIAVWGAAFAAAAFWLFPLVVGWRFTTPYNDPWLEIGWRQIVPPLLWPFAPLSILGLALAVHEARRGERPCESFMFLMYSALTAVALTLAGSMLGVVNVRFLPFAQLALCLAGAVTLARVVGMLRAPHCAALGFTLLAVVYADGANRVLHSWIEWDNTGLEVKAGWPAFKRLAAYLRGSFSEPRVAVEYSAEHEKAGSIRIYETLPFFSGRSTLEGAYNQASLSSPAVYYLASELSPTAPNPYRNLRYSSFDPTTALKRLQLYNVRDIVAVSPTLTRVLDSSEAVVRVANVPPYNVFRLRNFSAGYVEPLRYAPVRSSWDHWRERSYEIQGRKPPAQVQVVFTDDDVFEAVDVGIGRLPMTALPDDVRVSAELRPEEIVIRTNRVGHPLLVKVSYHPRWRAEGADGPYLTTPAMMLIVPRRESVRLIYDACAWDDVVGRTLSILFVLAWIGHRTLVSVRRRKEEAALSAQSSST